MRKERNLFGWSLVIVESNIHSTVSGNGEKGLIKIAGHNSEGRMIKKKGWSDLP